MGTPNLVALSTDLLFWICCFAGLIWYVVSNIIEKLSKNKSNASPVAPPIQLESQDTLVAKINRMERMEAEAVLKPAAFRRTCWYKTLEAHFSGEWLILGAVSIGFWVSGVWGESNLSAYVWRVMLFHCVIGILFWLIASGRTRMTPAKLRLPYSDKVLSFLGINGISWLTFGLAVGCIPLLYILDLMIANATYESFNAIWSAYIAGMVLLLLAAKTSRLFPLYDSLTDRTFEVTAQRCPLIFQMVQEAAQSSGLPAPKRIYLAHNSSMAHIDTYLTQRDSLKGRITELRLGLRHILLLTQDELRAVIVHELRHQEHDSALRVALCTVMNAIRGKNAIKERIAADLEMRLCLIMRLNEKESDLSSASIDRAATACALARIHAYEIAFQRFWDNIDGFVFRHPKMPGGPRQIELLRAAEPDFDQKLRSAYAEALLYVTLPGATHPELSDRLHAIGHTPPLTLPSPSGPLAKELLDRDGQSFLQRQEQEWMSRSRDSWDKKWAEQSVQAQLLDTPHENYAKMSPEQLKNLGTAIWYLRSPAESLAAMEAYFAAKPKVEIAEYWVHEARLDARIPSADLALLDFSRSHLRCRTGIASVAIAWKLQGRDQEAKALWREFLLTADVLMKDKQERETLRSISPIQEHALLTEDFEKLRGVCLDYGVISEAYICRRALTYVSQPEEHIIILSFATGADGRFRVGFDKYIESAIEAIKAAWAGSEGELWVINEDQIAHMAQRIRALPNSRLIGSDKNVT